MSDKDRAGAETIQFPVRRSDVEIAAEFRNKARAHLELLAELLNAADREGMRISFQIGRDGFGRNVVLALDIVKVL